MPAEIVNSAFCATAFAEYRVRGSQPDTWYTITLDGSEYGHCTCKGFQYRQDCRHMREVWEKACLWNPQWRNAVEVKLKPVSFLRADQHIEAEECPNCGGPMVPVRIAV